MKTLKVSIVLVLSAVAALATTSTYQAPTGTIAPYVQLNFVEGGSADFREAMDGICNVAYPCYFGVWTYGGLIGFNYTLPDGTTATFMNLEGVQVPVSGTVYPTWSSTATASGTDSTGAPVSITITFVCELHSRSGRGGGNYYVYKTGSMTVSR